MAIDEIWRGSRRGMHMVTAARVKRPEAAVGERETDAAAAATTVEPIEFHLHRPREDATTPPRTLMRPAVTL